MVLRVHYDTVSWMWAIPQEKLLKLAEQVKAFIEVLEARQD
jgi:hypothetical protein